MGSSRILYRGIEKALGDKDSTIEEKRRRIEDLFVRSLTTVPDRMGHDLFMYYISRTGNEVENLRNLAYHLVDVVDLFDEAYDDRRDPVDDGELSMIRDLVNVYAQDIEDDILTYVMRLVIERGLFS